MSWKIKVLLLVFLGMAVQACGRIWGTINWLNSQSALSYAYCSNSLVFATGSPVNFSPSVASGGPFNISPNLPLGLLFNSQTGVITGQPSVVSGPTTYTISSSYSSTTLNIQTVNGYVVNDLGDATDATPGNHICATASGTCTLRAAIVESNADGAGTWNIIVPPGTISLGSTIILQNTENIFGSCPGPTIVDGGSSVQMFLYNANNLTVSMQDLTLQNGFVAGGHAGAIFSNFEINPIFSGTRLNFYNNTASGAAGGGGAVTWGGTFNCTDCVFSNNQAGDDGGALQGSAFVMNRCLFYNNKNTAGVGAGGAIQITGGTNSFTNCTFVSNADDNNGGGAIYFNAAGTYTLTNNTFVNNSTTSAFGAGAVDGNGAIAITFVNNLFYNNTGGLGQCNANATSLGGNLSSPASTHCTFAQPTDLTSMPSVGPLQNNGGFSNTFALLLGSAGIDQAVPGFCPSVDQRNYSRLVDGKCDIGAYESSP